MKLRESILKLSKLKEQYISLDDDIHMLPCDDGVIISFKPADTFSIINGEMPELAYSIDIDNLIFEDEMNNDFSYRLASTVQINQSSLEDILQTGIVPSIYQLKKLSNSQPIMLKIAQVGGQGGQGVGGIGQGIGVGNPMAGGSSWDSADARIQFDKTLDIARTNGRENDWSTSFEKRMQKDPLYGHQRNDQDWNIKNYTMTYKERRNEKKKQFLKRMFENRERFDKMVDEHSVASIKASPIDPKYYIPVEEKLKNKRQQEDNIEPRKDRHGPESQFTYFPKPPRQVTAQTIVHNGLSSIFDNDPESYKNEKAYPDSYNGRLRIRQHPWALYGPTRDGQMLDINNYPNTSTKPTDFSEDNNLLWGGTWNNAVSNDQGGTIAMDYLVDAWATGENPGEIQKPIFDKEKLSGIAQEMKNHLLMQEKSTKNPPKEDIPLEKKLESEHYPPQFSGITPTNYDRQKMDDPYPYSSKNFFMPRMRLNHSGG